MIIFVGMEGMGKIIAGTSWPEALFAGEESRYFLNMTNTSDKMEDCGQSPGKGIVDSEQVNAIAAMLKTMSHPIRLKILCLLQEKELTVGDIREEVKTTNANVSQHLSILRNQGIITYRKDANFIYNRIADERVLELMKKMSKLYCEEK